MNKISKICGIFAVGTMMLSTFFVTSCNSEDDFDFGPDSQYSLADRKMTRAGEHYIHGTPVKAGTSSNNTVNLGGMEYIYTVSWTRGFSGMTVPISNIYVTAQTGNNSDIELPNDPYYISGSGTWKENSVIAMSFRYSELDIPTGTIPDDNTNNYPRKQRIVTFDLPVKTVYDSTLVAL